MRDGCGKARCPCGCGTGNVAPRSETSGSARASAARASPAAPDILFEHRLEILRPPIRRRVIGEHGSKLDSAMEKWCAAPCLSRPPAAKAEANSTTANVRANLTASPCRQEGPGVPMRRPRYNPNIRERFYGDGTWAKATFELAAARSSTAATERNGRTSRNSGRNAERSALMMRAQRF